MYEVPKTEVIFRYWKSEAIALFPYEIADFDGNCLSYMTVGQHSAANYDVLISVSRLATSEEYASLQEELARIGYNLKIVQRRQYQRYRRAVVDAMSRTPCTRVNACSRPPI